MNTEPIKPKFSYTICSQEGQMTKLLRNIFKGGFEGRGGRGEESGNSPVDVCVQLTSVVNTEGNATQ